MDKQVFALYFGNRGFFPESLIETAREEMIKAVLTSGHDYIIPDIELTKYGAVESREDGKKYAKWLKGEEGNYSGVIICLPNFGDENGAIAALEECGVPILIQAYPDEIGKMDFEHRRDAYCGKFSIEDVFGQYNLKFTVLEPHVVHPASEAFAGNLQEFSAICRVVNGMKKFTVGAIGARTTKFKTVRFDEITLQKYGITVETFDLSEFIFRVQNKSTEELAVQSKINKLINYTNFEFVPEEKINTIAKAGVVLDEYIKENDLDALTIRCWTEMQSILGIAPCVLLSELNDRKFVASCEIDLCSAINMYSMQLASEEPTACLDWNNNYGDDPNKVILFHCGPVAQKLMKAKGTVTDHKMFAKENPNSGWGSNEGDIRSFPMTYSNCKTEDGKLTFYVDEGKFTEDNIEKEFFGCGGVALIDDLQRKLIKLGRNGYRHHTAIGVGHMTKVLEEAFVNYLGYDLMNLKG